MIPPRWFPSPNSTSSARWKGEELNSLFQNTFLSQTFQHVCVQGVFKSKFHQQGSLKGGRAFSSTCFFCPGGFYMFVCKVISSPSHMHWLMLIGGVQSWTAFPNDCFQPIPVSNQHLKSKLQCCSLNVRNQPFLTHSMCFPICFYIFLYGFAFLVADGLPLSIWYRRMIYGRRTKNLG